MPLSSMTGFARSEVNEETHAWVWELRSVNGRGLDVRFRVPPGLDSLDLKARQCVSAALSRGNVTLSLTLLRTAAQSSVQINWATLEAVLGYLAVLAERLPDHRPPALDGILALRGVLETADEETDEGSQQSFEAALLASLAAAVEALKDMRRQEGRHLAEVLRNQIGQVAALTEEAARVAATQPAALRERLCLQLQALRDEIQGVSEERLAQEVALLATKADVREELDRLAAHCAAARALIDASEPVGRKLEFLCQEFNREANTLCAKSTDATLTRIGIDLKTVIDQMREQVQNVE